MSRAFRTSWRSVAVGLCKQFSKKFIKSTRPCGRCWEVSILGLLPGRVRERLMKPNDDDQQRLLLEGRKIYLSTLWIELSDVVFSWSHYQGTIIGFATALCVMHQPNDKWGCVMKKVNVPFSPKRSAGNALSRKQNKTCKTETRNIRRISQTHSIMSKNHNKSRLRDGISKMLRSVLSFVYSLWYWPSFPAKNR